MGVVSKDSETTFCPPDAPVPEAASNPPAVFEETDPPPSRFFCDCSCCCRLLFSREVDVLNGTCTKSDSLRPEVADVDVPAFGDVGDLTLIEREPLRREFARALDMERNERSSGGGGPSHISDEDQSE